MELRSIEESLAMKWSRLASAMASASTNSSMALRHASVVSATAVLGREEPSFVSGACFTNASIAKTGDEQRDASHQSCNWHATAWKSDMRPLDEVGRHCGFTTAYNTKLVAGLFRAFRPAPIRTTLHVRNIPRPEARVCHGYEKFTKPAHSAGNPRRKAPSRA